jgi:hypothetical protein
MLKGSTLAFIALMAAAAYLLLRPRTASAAGYPLGYPSTYKPRLPSSPPGAPPINPPPGSVLPGAPPLYSSPIEAEYAVTTGGGAF